MSPARFVECLILIRWTPINLASALQCELSWIEAMEAGYEPIPDELETWIEALAGVHARLPPLRSFRGRRSAA
jgi:hypothetical protein